MGDNTTGRSHGRGQSGRWLAGVAGLTTVGAVAGISVARSVGRSANVDDPYAAEDFELIDGDRSYVLTTPDGVPLAVREVGPDDARLTVIFVHGFCQRMGAFCFQRATLAEQWGPQVRMVFYDQRGHGRSGEAPPETYTVEQLGRDLDTVLAVMAPRGPVVLVGHSMGGMTVLSHARQFPNRYPAKVVGAAIISSAAEGISGSPLGAILRNPALEAALLAGRYAPGMLHRTRGAARSVLGPILRAASYGDSAVSPSVVAFSEKMMHDTPIATLVEFLHAFEVHDESAALSTLTRVPTLIACGGRDLLTPMEHSLTMAEELPDSELEIFDGAGHLVQLEQPGAVDDALVRLVERATPSKLVAMTRRLRERAQPNG